MLKNIKLTIPFFFISQDGGEGGGKYTSWVSVKLEEQKKSLGHPLKFDSLTTLLIKKLCLCSYFFRLIYDKKNNLEFFKPKNHWQKKFLVLKLECSFKQVFVTAV